MLIVFLVFMATALAMTGRADTISTIDFEHVPVLPAGPVYFTDAGPAQTIDVPGIATVRGGVVLGLASALSGNPWVTAPNMYLTASDNLIGAGAFGLPDTITITVPPGVNLLQATFPVINGMPGAESYAVAAFAGSAQLSQALFNNIPSFGYSLANVTGTGITSMTITPLDTSAWDFAVDSIVVREMASSDTTSTPEPATAALVLAGVGTMFLAGRRRSRNPRHAT